MLRSLKCINTFPAMLNVYGNRYERVDTLNKYYVILFEGFNVCNVWNNTEYLKTFPIKVSDIVFLKIQHSKQNNKYKHDT